MWKIIHHHGPPRPAGFARARAESFNKMYGIVHPAEQYESLRPPCAGRLYERARDLGAVFHETARWRPHSMQVGQTGTKITPDLYLARGISGAIQRFAGCAGARHITAVNTDRDAPMMTRAD